MRRDVEGLPGGDETILLVDDNDNIWDAATEQLQRLGYSVILAENGVDAVDIYRQNPRQIDLVILDMLMPRMGGHEAFYQLKAVDPDVKVLIISGHVPEEDVSDLLSRGARGYLKKPHGLVQMAQAVRNALDGLPVEGGAQ